MRTAGGLKLRKAQKRLKRRQRVFDEHGGETRQNPGKQEGGGQMRMHRPGSNRK